MCMPKRRPAPSPRRLPRRLAPRCMAPQMRPRVTAGRAPGRPKPHPRRWGGAKGRARCWPPPEAAPLAAGRHRRMPRWRLPARVPGQLPGCFWGSPGAWASQEAAARGEERVPWGGGHNPAAAAAAVAERAWAGDRSNAPDRDRCLHVRPMALPALVPEGGRGRCATTTAACRRQLRPPGAPRQLV